MKYNSLISGSGMQINVQILSVEIVNSLLQHLAWLDLLGKSIVYQTLSSYHMLMIQANYYVCTRAMSINT